MPFQIIRNDITKVKADAIVNTANPEPIYAAGTDSAIYEAAGADKLLAERKKIGAIKRGDIAVTSAFKLRTKYIIHTVGPAWEGGKKGEFDILRSCYGKSLIKAHELGCESIAFPLIATGVYGFPKDEALRIAMNEISSFLMRDDVDMTVKLVVFDDKAFRLSQNLFFQVESFISDEDVIEAHREDYGLSEAAFNRERSANRRRCEADEYDRYYASNDYCLMSEIMIPDGIDDLSETGAGGKVGKKTGKDHDSDIKATGTKPFNEHTFDKKLYMNDSTEELSFQQHLLDLIIEKNFDNTVVYKSSNVSKGAFSKILCGDTKKPQKKTVLGLCIGLKLSLEEAKELLASADMAFNSYNKRDKLVIQCLIHGQYNIDEVNAMLYVCGQPLLGN